MIDAEKYNISIRKVVEGGGEAYYEAKVKELPDIADYADSFHEAYDLALDSIKTTYAYFKEKGKVFPAPYVANEVYSGRITLRVPKTLHRFLAESSEDEGVSLNQHIVNILTYYSGIYATPFKAFSWFASDVLTSKYDHQKSSQPQRLRLVNRADRPLPLQESLGWR